MTSAAEQIVDLQHRLNTGQGDSVLLQQEQRELWDTHYPEVPYDHIVWDSWAVRRSENAGCPVPA